MRRHLLAFAALTLLAGCVTAPPPPPRNPLDPRVMPTPPVAALLDFAQPRVGQGTDGRMQLTLDVRNPTDSDVPIRFRVEWLNASGRPLNSLQSRTRGMLVPRNGISTIDSDAPNTQAREFRILIDLDTP